MDQADLKRAIAALPSEPSAEGVDFKAFKGAGKDDGEPVMGMYIGVKMLAAFNKDKNTITSPMLIVGTVKRSAKAPNARLVLETKTSKGLAREVARECFKQSKLNYVPIIAKPGEVEPEPGPEDTGDGANVPPGPPTTSGSAPPVPPPPPPPKKAPNPKAAAVKDQLGRLLPAILANKNHPVAGKMINTLYADAKKFIEQGDYDRAAAKLRNLDELLTTVTSGGPKGTGSETDATAALNKAVATLKKTVDYAKGQLPDEGVRILELVKTQLVEEEVKFRKAAPTATLDPATVIAPIATAVDQAIAALEQKAIAEVQEHCTTLLALKNGALKAPSPPPTEAGAKGDRALKLLKGINEIDEQLHLDRATLKRLGITSADATLAKVQAMRDEFFAEWQSLAPGRKSGGDPRPPTTVAEESLPIPPALNNPEFINNCKKVTASISKGEKPDPEARTAMLAQAALALDVEGGDWKKDLTTKFGHDWNKVRAEFKNKLKTDATKAKEWMTGWWWFRKYTTESLMKKLVGKYNFKWLTAGSPNLESDIDISVQSHGKKPGTEDPFRDWEIVEEFNQEMAKQFGGKQPGIVFDVNLYAEAPPPPIRPPANPTEKAMAAMSEAGQDAGALMKMRRFMSWEDFVAFQEETLADMKAMIAQEPDTTKKAELEKRLAATKRQFEQADDNYQLAMKKTLCASLGLPTGGDATPEDQADPTAEQKKIVAALKSKGVEVPDAVLADPIQWQHFLEEQMERLEADPAQMMETTNKLYAEAMREVRVVEGQIEALTGTDPDTMKKKAALIAKLKTLQTDAVFFANEAYHTPAAFKHIVEANQVSARQAESAPIEGTDPEDIKRKRKALEQKLKNEALGSLTITQLMQSFNEQLGDFLKDAKHYEVKSGFPGTGFVRASKYLERMCDAIELMGNKLAGTPWAGEFAAIKMAGKSPGEMKTALGILVQLRGGKIDFTAAAAEHNGKPENKDNPMDPSTEAQAFATEKIQELFGSGVKTLRDLTAQAKVVGRKVNALLRKADAGQKLIAEDERAYFGGQ
jgi:hypothetical protein